MGSAEERSEGCVVRDADPGDEDGEARWDADAQDGEICGGMATSEMGKEEVKRGLSAWLLDDG